VLSKYNRSHLVARKVRNTSQGQKNWENHNLSFTFYVNNDVPSDTQKEAAFCMILWLVDIIWELILISLFAEISWTKHFSV
jgi:hypothetical protein